MNTQQTKSFLGKVDAEIAKFRKLQDKYAKYGARDSEPYWYLSTIIENAKGAVSMEIRPKGFQLYTSDEKLGKGAEKAEIALAKQAQKVYDIIFVTVCQINSIQTY